MANEDKKVQLDPEDIRESIRQLRQRVRRSPFVQRGAPTMGQTRYDQFRRVDSLMSTLFDLAEEALAARLDGRVDPGRSDRAFAVLKELSIERL